MRCAAELAACKALANITTFCAVPFIRARGQDDDAIVKVKRDYANYQAWGSAYDRGCQRGALHILAWGSCSPSGSSG